MKILVIDDEKPTLSMFRLFLAAYGYEVHTADSGEAGLEVAAQIKPEIVFTDIRMPGIDGLEVLDQIRKTHTRCQVIIITGHGDMERAVEAMDMGASDFINKPVERQALNAALIRAENRLILPGTPPFSIERITAEDACFMLTGHLDRESGIPIVAALTGLGKGAEVQLRFSPDISMDRGGISVLTDTLKRLSDKGHQIRISGLSYNILKFFEMAGIHKMADLEACDPEEPRA
jgi:CheY-like chemotaxis protein